MMLTNDDMRQVLRYRSRPERSDVMNRIGLDSGNTADHAAMYRIFRAIGDVVRRRKRCVFPGLGTFEWRPRKGRLPTGESFSSRHLVFTLTRSDRRKSK